MMGAVVHAALLRRLNQVKKDAFGTIELANNDHEAAEAQLNTLIEYSWVAVDLLADLSNYKLAREQAEAILGARKNQKKTRDVWNAYLKQVKQLAPFPIIEHIRDKRMLLHPVTNDVDGALLFKRAPSRRYH
jgi:hypothetical protein